MKISTNAFFGFLPKATQFFGAALLSTLFLFTATANAATITVTNGNDTGAGSLRNAITSALAGDIIQFSGVTTVTLTSAELLINKNLTINGGSGVTITRSGGTAFRIFQITSGTVTFNNLTISNGNASSQGGGGVLVASSGNLTLNTCVIQNNTASEGAGLSNNGTMILNNCTIKNNTSTLTVGGGLLTYGGSVLTMTSCTVNGNTNGSGGAAVDLRGGGGGAINALLTNCTVSGNNNVGVIVPNTISTLSLVNCTVTGNNIGLDNLAAGQVTLKNTIVADNTFKDIDGNVSSSSSYNLIGTGGAGGLTNGVNNNQVGVANPGLGTLASNGGPTQTHALSTCSPAINTGTNTGAPTTDQRGSTRPYNASVSDIGAYELQSAGGPVTMSSSVTNVLCNGGNTGVIDLTITNGTPPFTYVWTGSGSGGDPRTNLFAGTYTVTVTATGGCTGTKVSTVTQPTVISITKTSTNVSCNGGSNGSITLTVSGGTGSYTYTWTGAGSGSNPRTGLAAGPYTVTVTDANGCTKTNATLITQPQPIAITPTVTNASCAGSDNGTIALGVIGGTSPYTYAWTGAGSGTNPRTSLLPGIYTVTVTDTESCTKTSSSTVGNSDIVVPSITCPANQTVNAMSGNYSLADFTASATASDNCGASPIITQAPTVGTNLTAGNHTITLTATDDANNTNTCDFTLTVQAGCPATGTTWYVNASAASGGDGSSWACAFQNLQDAIDAASSGHEIWVNAGTYKPTKDPSGNASPTDPRDKVFYLKDGVALYGGFAGTETLRTQRNWTTNPTILSGDIGTANGSSDNCYHVVLSVSDSGTTVVDGFKIQNGNANGSGSLTVETQTIPRNEGGGMRNHTSQPTLSNCVFSTNQAGKGGGIFNSDTGGL